MLGRHPVLALLALGACGSPPSPRAEAEPAPGTASAGHRPPPAAATSEPVPIEAPPETSATTSSGPDPMGPVALTGPFPSLEKYRAQRPLSHDPSCGPTPKKVSAREQVLGGRGAIRAARWLRIADSIACAPIEHCVLALQTSSGWYVRESETPCHGTIGPGRTIQTRNEKLAWLSLGDVPVLRLELAVGHAGVEHEMTASGERTEHETARDTRRVLFCGAGSSGVPSCTAAIVLSCANAEGGTSEATWSVVEDRLVVASAVSPDSACVEDEPFVVGEYPLEFR